MPPSTKEASRLWDWFSNEKTLIDAVRSAKYDWVALECLANAPGYAKPDTEKEFALWEAKRSGPGEIRIETAPRLSTEHPWLYRLFVQPNIVRFPFNRGDSGLDDSLSWKNFAGQHHSPVVTYRLPRWSTASRSCLALIPERFDSLRPLLPKKRKRVKPGWRPTLHATKSRIEPMYATGWTSKQKVHVAEWQDLEEAMKKGHHKQVGRFFAKVGNPAVAASPDGVTIDLRRYRLYSVKTGVNYVGSEFEGGSSGKHRLEANSSMAMLRSEVICALPNKDPGFGVQTELLTISAAMSGSRRDGFQVRDLSCMNRRYSYVPAQAVPFVRRIYDGNGGAESQCNYWIKHFCVPLGRAKARLFLNYGLIHTSANAQNFVLGFEGKAMKHFVARDVGDTSWHDHYIGKYLGAARNGVIVVRAFEREAGAKVRHVLTETSSGDYPPPYIVRLAAYSLVTHGFGEKLGWPAPLLYRFLTGILDGFFQFVVQALLVHHSCYRHDPIAMKQSEIHDLGSNSLYPDKGLDQAKYRRAVFGCLKDSPQTLFGKAQYVRRIAGTIVTQGFARHAKMSVINRLRVVINAEEVLRCACIEKLLWDDAYKDDQAQWRKRLGQLMLSGRWPSVVA